ncbi:hypothetical protein Lche_1456 [Legionella cherrii]|uniref:Uncharacterized protein n=1 Tax=Legionella cherrii TaxID=28084 RepID=A0A0W0S767_9GAMM|nr:hypothetical protein [Legionella cherrii]KTC79436.1 hypothetical protein Lche_1456 [Legionella cherrii]
MHKKIEILNRIKPVSTICLLTKSGKMPFFDVRTEVTQQYGTFFLDRVMTPKGLATVIGKYNGYLWLWIDGEAGPTYWDHVVGNVFNLAGFSPAKDTNYPDAVKKALNTAIGFEIPFDELTSLDLLILINELDQYSPESLADLLKRNLKIDPQNMSKQLGLLIQKFNTLSVSDLEFLAELAEPVPESKGSELVHFIQDTKLGDVAKTEASTINQTVINLQIQIDELAEKLKLVQKETQPLLYDMLSKLKVNLEESRLNLSITAEALNSVAVAPQLTYLKRISLFHSFNILIKVLMEVYLELQMNQDCPSDLGHYLQGVCKITQFLYDHGHYFFDVEAEQSANNNNKEGASESFSRLELMYLFLLISGHAAMSKKLSACVYLEILDALRIKSNADENMPETFDISHFVSQKPDDFIKLYRSFFVEEGIFRQKVEELIGKKHPILLTELGKLTCYYAAALEARARRADAKPGAQSEVNYYLKQGVNYLLQALKQGLPQAAEAIDILLTNNKKRIGLGAELAKEMASHFSKVRNFAKAHYYLDIALKFQDKGTKAFRQELDIMQIELTLLEQGKGQEQAISRLFQLIKEGSQSALALLNKLSVEVPAIAFAAVVYWHREDITKLSSEILKCAAKEKPDEVAWFQNRYQVVCEGQQPNLALILKAVKVGFAPAIVELNGLLVSNADYLQENTDEILPILSDFDISQHITPGCLVALLVNYHIQNDLSDEALNKFIYALAHTSFKKPSTQLELLILVLRDLRASIGSDELISVLHAIKRIGGLAKENHDLMKTIATLIIEREAAEDKSMFHFFVQEFIPNTPALARALYNDDVAWDILKNNNQILDLIIEVIEDNEDSMEKSAHSNLSLFNEKNKENQQVKLSREENGIDMDLNSKTSQNGYDESGKAEVPEDRSSFSLSQ